MNELDRWEEFGQFVVERRKHLGLNRRAAAKRAGMSEAVWRELEAGHSNSFKGVRVLPNPTQELLTKMAEVLEVTPEELVSRVGRPRRRTPRFDAVGDDELRILVQKLHSLSEADRRLVERLVDRMVD